MADEIYLWRWRYVNEFGKRVTSSWHMCEEDAKRYKDAEKVEASLEIRKPIGSMYRCQGLPPKS
jgi:hypothetical protein